MSSAAFSENDLPLQSLYRWEGGVAQHELQAVVRGERALGEPDAFPAADLGLLAAVSGESGPIRPAELARRAEAWRPWRAYGAIQIWLGPVGKPAARTA